MLTPPRVIAGGGIGDGPIDGVANVYVIDDATRMPVSGATVRVGELDGTTDADGLFIAEGVSGPQTVVVKASGYRSEMWVGANGANMTFNLTAAAEAVPASATLSGTVNTAGITVAAGHTLRAQVAYSQTDDVGAPENEIETPGNMSMCITGIANNMPCDYSIEVRTGRISLIAAIFDRDLNGTPSNFDDDSEVLVRWAVKTNIDVTANVDITGQTLDLIPANNQNTVTVSFGTPPAGNAFVAGLVGLELGPDEVFQLPVFATPQATQLVVPSLAQFSGSTYRLTALATNGMTPTSWESFVLRRGLTGTTLDAGTWMAPVTSTMVSRTGASWAPAAGATVHAAEYTQGTANLLNVTVLDGAISQFTIPDLVALPSGAVTVDINALGAPGLDPQNFSLDADQAKLNAFSSQPHALN